MSEAYDFGREAEQKAADFLSEKGFKILDRNWFFGKAELDIIAQKQQVIHFVEVKARSFGSLTTPEDAVNAAKRKHIREAANAYIEKYDLDLEAQFDIITVTKRGNQWTIEWIEDAFGIV